MGDSSFDAIVQEIMQQKRIMEQLEEENRALHRQLADLRDGRGIFLDIHGIRYALIGNSLIPDHDNIALASLPMVDLAEQEQEQQEEQLSIQEQPTMQITLYDTADAPTEAMSELDEIKVADVPPAFEGDGELDEETAIFTVDDVTNGHRENTVDHPTHPGRETPLPINEFDDEEEMIPSPPPPFLEELVVDEFAVASSNPRAVWTPPRLYNPRKQTKKLEMHDEATKAALRRELIGSFLLE